MTTLAEVLHHAADYHLKDSEDDTRPSTKFQSCYAIESACRNLLGDQAYIRRYKKCMKALKNHFGLTAFGMDSIDQPNRQHARFIWLKFAAIVVEDDESINFVL